MNETNQFKICVASINRLIYSLNDPLRIFFKSGRMEPEFLSFDENRVGVAKLSGTIRTILSEVIDELHLLAICNDSINLEPTISSEIGRGLTGHIALFKSLVSDLDDLAVYFNSERTKENILIIHEYAEKLSAKIGMKKKYIGETGTDSGFTSILFDDLKRYSNSLSNIITKSRYKTAQISDFESPIFHGIRELEHAVMALAQDSIKGYTTQRYWSDGKRRIDTDPEYNSSFWMKGISLTRDFKFAANWGDVVFILNRDKIITNNRLVPFAWNYIIGGLPNRNAKKEREEFLITRKTGKTFKGSEEDPESDRINVSEFTKPEGEMKNLNSILVGIFMDEDSLERWGAEDANVKYLTSHPLFKGFYSRHNIQS